MKKWCPHFEPGWRESQPLHEKVISIIISDGRQPQSDRNNRAKRLPLKNLGGDAGPGGFLEGQAQFLPRAGDEAGIGISPGQGVDLNGGRADFGQARCPVGDMLRRQVSARSRGQERLDDERPAPTEPAQPGGDVLKADRGVGAVEPGEDILSNRWVSCDCSRSGRKVLITYPTQTPRRSIK